MYVYLKYGSVVFTVISLFVLGFSKITVVLLITFFILIGPSNKLKSFFISFCSALDRWWFLIKTICPAVHFFVPSFFLAFYSRLIAFVLIFSLTIQMISSLSNSGGCWGNFIISSTLCFERSPVIICISVISVVSDRN